MRNNASLLQNNTAGKNSLRSRLTYHIENPTSPIGITGKTPSNRACKEKEAAKCRLPLLVPLCDGKGGPAGGIKCDICNRRTKLWCLGCHRHFCNDVQKHQSKFRKGVGFKIRGPESITNVNLSMQSKKRKSACKPQEQNLTRFKFT